MFLDIKDTERKHRISVNVPLFRNATFLNLTQKSSDRGDILFRKWKSVEKGREKKKHSSYSDKETHLESEPLKEVSQLGCKCSDVT